MKRVIAAILALMLIFSVTGCVKKSDTYVYKDKDNSWSIKVPNEFIKDREETDEQQKTNSVYFKTEKETYLVINEIKDEKLEINEEKLKEELEVDDYIKVSRYDTVEIKNVGKAYGAVLTDEATNMSMLYYRLKYKDSAVSFILYRKGAFAPEQEAKAIAMISTFKGLKR
jgi:predicted small lipoprotein YifL